MRSPRSPGMVLRALRLARHFTQEELAARAGVSTRHLSCLETGRALPSQEMLLLLGTALDLPLRDRNTVLAAAGFAPIYRETSLDHQSMEHVRLAVDHLLAVHEAAPGDAARSSMERAAAQPGSAAVLRLARSLAAGRGPST